MRTDGGAGGVLHRWAVGAQIDGLNPRTRARVLGDPEPRSGRPVPLRKAVIRGGVLLLRRTAPRVQRALSVVARE